MPAEDFRLRAAGFFPADVPFVSGSTSSAASVSFASVSVATGALASASVVVSCVSLVASGAESTAPFAVAVARAR
jgi:hypothetical protein